MAWMDNAGLYRLYGTEQTVPNAGGEYRVGGELRDIDITIDLTELTEAETVVSNTIFFPKGMKIEQVEYFVDTAAATGVAIDLGLVQTNRSSEIDYQAFLKALPTASMTEGTKAVLVAGDSYAGDLVGGTTSVPGYLTASRTTSTAFTTGKIRVRIKYSRP